LPTSKHAGPLGGLDWEVTIPMTRRSLWLLPLSLLLLACEPSPLPRGYDDGTVQRYHLQGVVVRSDPARKVVSIQHGPIVNDTGKVWMAAMTMEFPVADPKDLPLLEVGRTVKAVVCSRQSDLQYWVEHVQPAGQ
jgi:Cu/Ag efflux protein CusF